jgi:hypothetical protein
MVIIPPYRRIHYVRMENVETTVYCDLMGSVSARFFTQGVPTLPKVRAKISEYSMHCKSSMDPTIFSATLESG